MIREEHEEAQVFFLCIGGVEGDEDTKEQGSEGKNNNKNKLE